MVNVCQATSVCMYGHTFSQMVTPAPDLLKASLVKGCQGQREPLQKPSSWCWARSVHVSQGYLQSCILSKSKYSLKHPWVLLLSLGGNTCWVMIAGTKGETDIFHSCATAWHVTGPVSQTLTHHILLINHILVTFPPFSSAPPTTLSSLSVSISFSCLLWAWQRSSPLLYCGGVWQPHNSTPAH